LVEIGRICKFGRRSIQATAGSYNQPTALHSQQHTAIIAQNRRNAEALGKISPRLLGKTRPVWLRDRVQLFR